LLQKITVFSVGRIITVLQPSFRAACGLSENGLLQKICLLRARREWRSVAEACCLSGRCRHHLFAPSNCLRV
jgi:hypothetical protein